MFVLRSVDLDSGFAAQPADGSRRVAAHDSAPAPREGRRPGAGRPDCGPLKIDAKRPDAASRPTAARAGNCGSAPMSMPFFAAAFAVRFGGATAASECPKHFGDVQALIDKVSAGVNRAGDRLVSDKAALIEALLDDARMLLDAARQNHEWPQGPYDHARAFAKADAALGHARAAQIVFSRSAQE